jgi:hypothetical protein
MHLCNGFGMRFQASGGLAVLVRAVRARASGLINPQTMKWNCRYTVSRSTTSSGREMVSDPIRGACPGLMGLEPKP